MENNPDIAALIGASAALTLSGVPFFGPIGAARVGWVDGAYVLNPTIEQMEQSDLDLVVAGTHEGVLMVESEAKELSEEIMLGAVNFGHDAIKPVIDAIIELAESCAKEPALPEEPVEVADINKVLAGFDKDFDKAYKVADKTARQTAVGEVRQKIKDQLGDGYDGVLVGGLIKEKEADIVRGAILKTGSRIDGRDTKTVRQIVSEAGFLPRAHGSALFTRGETQAMVVATLGTVRMSRSSMRWLAKADPAYAALQLSSLFGWRGWSYWLAGPSEIGHGSWLEALNPLLPAKDEFPYTIRLVSEITESNGSSSMATVCGSSLALMDAGVPLKRPVAGIAMGLIKEGDKFAVLSDILGDEDHLGDMDFKVAGTEVGVTSLQMDIKITSITPEIMEIALDQARDAAFIF